MTRKTETLSRRDFDALLADLDADTADQLRADLAQWDGGDTCNMVELTTDSLGRIDSESSPRPA